MDSNCSELKFGCDFLDGNKLRHGNCCSWQKQGCGHRLADIHAWLLQDLDMHELIELEDLTVKQRRNFESPWLHLSKWISSTTCGPPSQSALNTIFFWNTRCHKNSEFWHRNFRHHCQNRNQRQISIGLSRKNETSQCTPGALDPRQLRILMESYVVPPALPGRSGIPTRRQYASEWVIGGDVVTPRHWFLDLFFFLIHCMRTSLFLDLCHFRRGIYIISFPGALRQCLEVSTTWFGITLRSTRGYFVCEADLNLSSLCDLTPAQLYSQVSVVQRWSQQEFSLSFWCSFLGWFRFDHPTTFPKM